MLARLKFFFRDPPFLYNCKTGAGYRVLSYSVFTDKVHLQTSQFGYVTGWSYVTRKEYFTRSAQVLNDNLEVASASLANKS